MLFEKETYQYAYLIELFANFSLRESTKSKWKKLKTNLKLQMLQDSRRYLLPASVTVYVFNRLHPISKL